MLPVTKRVVFNRRTDLCRLSADGIRHAHHGRHVLHRELGALLAHRTGVDSEGGTDVDGLLSVRTVLQRRVLAEVGRPCHAEL